MVACSYWSLFVPFSSTWLGWGWVLYLFGSRSRPFTNVCVPLDLYKLISLYNSNYQDKYLHTNCLAALANMSSKFYALHPYVCQRINRFLSILVCCIFFDCPFFSLEMNTIIKWNQVFFFNYRLQSVQFAIEKTNKNNQCSKCRHDEQERDRAERGRKSIGTWRNWFGKVWTLRCAYLCLNFKLMIIARNSNQFY